MSKISCNESEVMSQDLYVVTGNEKPSELCSLDRNHPQIFLTLSAFRLILERYRDGLIDDEELRRIAETFEMNEAVLSRGSEQAAINEVVFQLANPDINGPINSSGVAALLQRFF